MDPNNINNPVGIPPILPPVVPNVISPGIVNAVPQNIDNVPVKPKGKIWKWIGIIVGGFVLTIIIMFVAVFTATGAPVKVANEQFNDIRQNNLEAAYNLFATSAKTEVTFSDLQTFVSENNLAGGTTASISFSSRQISGNTATLDGKITIDGTSANLEYKLIKEGSIWKVLSFVIIPQ